MEEYPLNKELTGKASQKEDFRLGLAALLLDFVPLLLICLDSALRGWLDSGPLSVLFFNAVILSPIVGIIMGTASLCRGKKRIGKTGVTLSALAVALPIAFIVINILLIVTGASLVGM